MIRESIGQRIYLEYVSFGQNLRCDGFLKKFDPFKEIVVETPTRTVTVKFIANTEAVKSLSIYDGQRTIKSLYNNTAKIPESYHTLNDNEVLSLWKSSFGDKVAEKLRRGDSLIGPVRYVFRLPPERRWIRQSL